MVRQRSWLKMRDLNSSYLRWIPGRMLHQAANTLHAAKSCSAIIYDSGYLVIKDDANCNYFLTIFFTISFIHTVNFLLGLKVYNLNGLYGQVVLTHTLPSQGEWKDRDFGTGPVRCLLRKCAGNFSSILSNLFLLQLGINQKIFSLY